MILATAVLVMLPSLALAADVAGTTANYSFFASFVQMVAALAIVIGLIFLTYYVSNKLMRGMPALRQSARHIRVIEVRPMGPRKALVLIEVGGEYLLLSNTEQNLSLIKQIEMHEDIEVIDEPPQRPSFLSFLKKSSASL